MPPVRTSCRLGVILVLPLFSLIACDAQTQRPTPGPLAQPPRDDAGSTTPTPDVGTTQPLDGPGGTCPAGTIDQDNDPSTPCISLSDCPAGGYLKGAGSDRMCVPCASGMFSTTANASACSAWTVCKPGEYVARSGSLTTDQTCAACPNGKVSTTMNAAQCVDRAACPGGTEQAAPIGGVASQGCVPCEAGTFCAGGGATKQPCAADTWDHDGNASSACVPRTVCAPGQYVSAPGSATVDRACAACPPGQFSAEMNASSCVDWKVCGEGTYVSTAATAIRDRVCFACASGQFSLGSNATACTPWQDCVAGTYSAAPSATADRACLMCAAGTLSTQPNQTACLPANTCAAGTELTAPATATKNPLCSPCAAGTYCAGGTAPAQACGDDSWDHDQNAATPCVARTTCMPGSYAMVPGSATADRKCAACATGTYTRSANAPSCSPWSICPAGTYRATLGSATDDQTCLACPAGKYSNPAGSIMCAYWTTCMPGTYVTNAPTATIDRTCAACAAETYNTTANATSCTGWTTCTPGQYVSTAGSASSNRVCSACPGGQTTLTNNATMCQTTGPTIAAGLFHTCAVRSGALRCWGYNSNGELGYGHTDWIGDDETPASAGDVNVGAPVQAVVAGRHHTCVLISGGAVRCWGRGESGQLGYENTNSIGDDETPASAGNVNVGGTVVQLAAGGNHTCALLSAGNVRCWGLGGSGRLGYGNTNSIGDDETPASAGNVNVGGTVIQISAGDAHTCATLAGGAVRCWGLGFDGRLGYGNTNTLGDDETPTSAGDVDVGGTTAQVWSGISNTCAVLSGGRARCWGSGAFGQNGHSNTITLGDDETPAGAGDVDVGGTVTSLVIGYRHSCVILSGGSVRCWGWGALGQLGYGNTNNIGDNETPASAGSVTVGGTAVEIAAGGYHTCVRLNDDNVRCWGEGATGQLGYGNTNNIGDDETPASAGNVPW